MLPYSTGRPQKGTAVPKDFLASIYYRKVFCYKSATLYHRPLLILDRAYALQRKNHVKIQNVTIKLPAIFESEDPRLLYGFVNLVNLFLAVDTTFLSSWNGNSKSSTFSKGWLTEVLLKLDASGVVSGESLETHDLDIAISRQWLQVLAWQIMVKHGLLTDQTTELPFSLRFPIQLAGAVIKITSSASQSSLDSHGIGMVSLLCIHIRGQPAYYSHLGTEACRYCWMS